MKALNLLLLSFLLIGSAAAQTSSRYPSAPGVAVVKNSWRTRTADSAMNEDPLRPSRERAEEETVQKEIIDDYKNTGGSSRRLPSRDVRWRTPRQPTRMVQYIFDAEIKNIGPKKMRRVVWEYVFLDAAGEREIGYRLFESNVNIAPGKTAKMVGYIQRYVNSAAEAKEANKVAREVHGKYMEIIAIRRIEYDDNSVWERPSK
jgi:hypothetical protein